MAELTIRSCNEYEVELPYILPYSGYLRIKGATLSCFSGYLYFYIFSEYTQNREYIYYKSLSTGFDSFESIRDLDGDYYCQSKLIIYYSNSEICNNCPEKLIDYPISLRYCLEIDGDYGSDFNYPITIIA